MDIIKRIATHLAECEAAPYKEMEPDAGPLLFACRDEIIAARACAEMMLQGTGQKIGEEWARRVMDQHNPPQWISVTERLPEELEQVIVWMPDCPHHPCGMDMGSCMTDSWGVSWMVSGGRSAFPTHWMPLPEPPEATK